MNTKAYRAIQKEKLRNAGKESAMIDRLIAYENGELDEAETIELFQGLVDTGLAWELQGSYGRAAIRFIDAGLVKEAL